jgi:hypothetical protein
MKDLLNLDKFKNALSKEGLGEAQAEAADKKLAGLIDEKFNSSKNAKQDTYMNWKRYIDLYQGKQNNTNMPSWKSKINQNMVFALIESTVPLMGDKMPEILILPTEENDIRVAQQLQEVISYELVADRFQEKLTAVIRDKLILGVGIWKIMFNPDAMNGLGKIETAVVDPFDLFPDPNATVPEEQEWCIFRTRMSLRKIRKLYPEKGMKVVSDNIYKNSDDVRGINNEKQITETSDLATLLEYWYYGEDGIARVAISANGILLEDKVTPYEKNDSFPFVWDYDHKLNGSLWGIGEVMQLESLQLQLNKVQQVIMDNLIANNNSIWIVDKSAGVKKHGLSNEPGLIVEKNPGGEIRRESPPSIPNYIINQLEVLKKAMEDTSGITDVSQGVMNNSVTAASAIQILTENSQTRIRSKLRNTEYAIQKLGEWYVSLIAQFYETRIVRITGGEGFKFVNFDASVMRQPDPSIMQPNPMTGQMEVMPENVDPETGRPTMELVSQFDVKISSGSSMLLNKNAKYQQQLELFQNGALDIETLLESAEIGDVTEITSRMVKYGVLKDPNQPQVDSAKLLQGLGLKFNMTSSDPVLIGQTLEKLQIQLDQMNQDPAAQQEIMANPEIQKQLLQQSLRQNDPSPAAPVMPPEAQLPPQF